MAVSTPSELGKSINVTIASEAIMLAALAILCLGVLGWCFFGSVTDREYIKGVIFPSKGTSGANIPSAGTVQKIFVHKGDLVSKGQTLALVAVSGSYSILSAPCDGEVLSFIPENVTFKPFEDIVDLLSDEESDRVRTIVAFANFNAARLFKPGMAVQITPSHETRERIGFVRGRITSVSPYPITRQEADIKLQNPAITDEIFPTDLSVFEVEIEMDPDPEDPSRLDWSFVQKGATDMSVGTFCHIEVVIRDRSIFEYLFENVHESINTVRLWGE